MTLHPLAQAAAHRTLDAEGRVRRALVDLDRQGSNITFVAVASQARVSRRSSTTTTSSAARSSSCEPRHHTAPRHDPRASEPATTPSAPDCARRGHVHHANPLMDSHLVGASELAAPSGRQGHGSVPLCKRGSHPVPDLTARELNRPALVGAVRTGAVLCRRLVAKLARKRPSPIERGEARVWVAGVIYAIGQNNFLCDPTQTPHQSPDQLSELVGVPKSTMAAKAKRIRDLVQLDAPMDPEFCRAELSPTTRSCGSSRSTV